MVCEGGLKNCDLAGQVVAQRRPVILLSFRFPLRIRSKWLCRYLSSSASRTAFAKLLVDHIDCVMRRQAWQRTSFGSCVVRNMTCRQTSAGGLSNILDSEMNLHVKLCAKLNPTIDREELMK